MTNPEAAQTVTYSFDELCLPYYNDMLAWARKLTNNNRQRAADLVQDSYLHAFKAWKRFELEPGADALKAVKGWLHLIVRHTFIKDYYRLKVRRVALEKRTDEIIDALHGSDMAEQERTATLADRALWEVYDSPFGDEVMDAISRLGNDHRAVVFTHYVDGLSCKAIAKKLGIPKPTVCTRLHRARETLEPLLRKYAASINAIPTTPADELPGAGVELAETAESSHSDSDGIDAVVAGDDDSDLGFGEPAAYQVAAG